MTTFSPSTVGSVARRMSSVRPTAEVESVMRPSCGFRRSAMSSFAEDLQPRRDPRRHALRDPLHLAEHAVDPEADDERLLLRLEVDVGGAFLGGLEDDGVHEPDERAVRDPVVGFEVVSLLRLVDLEDGDSDGLRRAHEPLELDDDVVARGHRELERVPRREPELVDRVDVPGIRDRDLEDVVLEGVGNGDRALERLHGNELRRVGCHSSCREVDERKVVPHRQHPGDAVGRRSALLDERVGDGRALGGPASDERELVGGDESRVLEEVEDELGGLVDVEGASQRLRGRSALARRAGRAQVGYPLEVHVLSLERVIGRGRNPP